VKVRLLIESLVYLMSNIFQQWSDSQMDQRIDRTIDFKQSISRLSDHRKPKAEPSSCFGGDLFLCQVTWKTSDSLLPGMAFSRFIKNVQFVAELK